VKIAPNLAETASCRQTSSGKGSTLHPHIMLCTRTELCTSSPWHGMAWHGNSYIWEMLALWIVNAVLSLWSTPFLQANETTCMIQLELHFFVDIRTSTISWIQRSCSERMFTSPLCLVESGVGVALFFVALHGMWYLLDGNLKSLFTSCFRYHTILFTANSSEQWGPFVKVKVCWKFPLLSATFTIYETFTNLKKGEFFNTNGPNC